jgi:hypothetical protein
MATTKEVYGNLTWWINVHQYFQVGEHFTGKRWRLCYDDTFIADFDHEPSNDRVHGSGSSSGGNHDLPKWHMLRDKLTGSDGTIGAV